ncbi:MAG: HAD-IIA family hydrolase [Candidatus Lokiarchaeota archaeon]|nr:HAD-IIA family hydrolase [Candidatus Lokiarchaeota archaeon]
MEKKKNLRKIKGILTDIDGTLYFKGKPIPGAIETLSKLRKKGLKFLFLTNTDSKSPLTILNILKDYGFDIDKDEIFTPIIALKEFLSENPSKKSFFVTTSEVEKEFQEFPKVYGTEIPEFVIIGDFHDNWDVNRLNEAFKYVIKGAKLLGTQGNKYYLDRDGKPVIDTGSFVKMIAYAANVDPKIFGKPSKEYFLQALRRINLEPDQVLVVGDDPESDIHGAINAGIKGILVRTGKGKFFDLSNSHIKPSKIIESFSSLINFL